MLLGTRPGELCARHYSLSPESPCGRKGHHRWGIPKCHAGPLSTCPGGVCLACAIKLCLPPQPLSLLSPLPPPPSHFRVSRAHGSLASARTASPANPPRLPQPDQPARSSLGSLACSYPDRSLSMTIFWSPTEMPLPAFGVEAAGSLVTETCTQDGLLRAALTSLSRRDKGPSLVAVFCKGGNRQTLRLLLPRHFHLGNVGRGKSPPSTLSRALHDKTTTCRESFFPASHHSAKQLILTAMSSACPCCTAVVLLFSCYLLYCSVLMMTTTTTTVT